VPKMAQKDGPPGQPPDPPTGLTIAARPSTFKIISPNDPEVDLVGYSSRSRPGGFENVLAVRITGKFRIMGRQATCKPDDQAVRSLNSSPLVKHDRHSPVPSPLGPRGSDADR